MAIVHKETDLFELFVALKACGNGNSRVLGGLMAVLE
jgi:hypothetical protein